MKPQLPIRKYNFLRALVAQPYFIFNTLKKTTEIDQNDDETELDFENLWNDDLVPEAFFPNMLKQRAALTFQKIDDHLIKILKRKTTTILSGSLETRLLTTNEILKNQTPTIIIKPVFEHNGAYSEPFAYDMFENTLINLKYSQKTSRLDIISGYYDWFIATKTVIVQDYNIFLFGDNDRAKKYEITLIPTAHAHTKKSPDKPQNGNGKTETELIKSFEQRFFLDKGRSKNPTKILLPDMPKMIAIIKGAVSAEISQNLQNDKTIWGANPEWNELLEKIKSPFANWSGNICPKDLIIKNPMALRFEKELGSEINTIKSPKIQIENLDEITTLEKTTYIQWYDFESYMLPIPATDFSKPYDQIVFQVSTILTEKEKVKTRFNHLFDPKTISVSTFKAIIDAVFDPRAEKYVVYNKGFELARLNEMVKKLGASGDTATESYQEKVETIKAKTIDLYDFFRISKGGKFPSILLPEQKGKASIKNVEKYINKHQIKLPVSVKPYQDLDVKNGFEAMGIAIDRALSITSDHAWSQKIEALKTYCENDVEAMRMVYYYIKHLIKINRTKM